MAEISEKLGKDPSIYKKEAELILSAINKELWIKDKGWWAEFKDNMGNRIRHDNAAIWTIYHAIDSDIHDPFKAYQATRYIDTEIPHIPVMGKGFEGYCQLCDFNNKLATLYVVYQQCRFRRNLTYRPCLLANRTL